MYWRFIHVHGLIKYRQKPLCKSNKYRTLVGFVTVFDMFLIVTNLNKTKTANICPTQNMELDSWVHSNIFLYYFWIKKEIVKTSRDVITYKYTRGAYTQYLIEKKSYQTSTFQFTYIIQETLFDINHQFLEYQSFQSL